MNDIELYHYFKDKSAIFNEMPPEDMWEKISANLTPAQKEAVSKSFLPKLFLLLAVIVGATLGIVATDNPMEEIPAKYDILPLQRDSTQVQTPKDTAAKKESKTVFKRLPKPKIRTVKGTPFMPVPHQKIDTAKVKAMVYKPTGHDTIPKNAAPIIIPDTKILNAADRIVISSTRKLSKSGFDSLVAKSIKVNEAALGKILIVKAPGHTPFRMRIPNVKPADTVFAKTLNFIPPNDVRKIKDTLK